MQFTCSKIPIPISKPLSRTMCVNFQSLHFCTFSQNGKKTRAAHQSIKTFEQVTTNCDHYITIVLSEIPILFNASQTQGKGFTNVRIPTKPLSHQNVFIPRQSFNNSLTQNLCLYSSPSRLYSGAFANQRRLKKQSLKQSKHLSSLDGLILPETTYSVMVADTGEK